MDLSEEILGIPRKFVDLSEQTHKIIRKKPRNSWEIHGPVRMDESQPNRSYHKEIQAISLPAAARPLNPLAKVRPRIRNSLRSNWENPSTDWGTTQSCPLTAANHANGYLALSSFRSRLGTDNFWTFGLVVSYHVYRKDACKRERERERERERKKERKKKRKKERERERRKTEAKAEGSRPRQRERERDKERERERQRARVAACAAAPASSRRVLAQGNKKEEEEKSGPAPRRRRRGEKEEKKRRRGEEEEKKTAQA